MPASSLPYVPRLPPDILRRGELLSRLDGPAALVVVRGHGGTGKTTLLAQWAREAREQRGETVVWLEAGEGTRTRTGFWLRVLGRMHAQQLFSDSSLHREMATIADHPDAIVATMRRTLDMLDKPLTLVLDDVGSPQPGSFWDQVCTDLIEVLRVVPRFRCIAAGRFWTELNGPASRRAVSMDQLTDDDLVLSEDEVRTAVSMFAPDLPGHLLTKLRKSALLDNPSSRRFSVLRFSLDALSQSPLMKSDSSEISLEALLIDAARRAMHGHFRDPALREFMLVTAQSPLVDEELAGHLTGREDSQEMLAELERLGAGQWEESRNGAAPVFRYTEHLQAAAALEYQPRSLKRRREVDLTIAHWLVEVRGENLAAFEKAIQAEGLAYAEKLLMRLYPLPEDDASHITSLLSRFPIARLRAFPVLTLWMGAAAYENTQTRHRAAEFFRASVLAVETPGPRSTAVERALQEGVVSVARRLLGQHGEMRELALKALPVLAAAVEDVARDRSLDSMMMAAIDQCAMSLFYAEEYHRALEARMVQIHFADSLSLSHQRNVALSNIALIEVIRGEFVSARTALARIDHSSWPENWVNSYADAPERIARAWIALSDGNSEDALACVEKIHAYEETTEHWDLIGGVRALALATSGRAHEALERTRRLRAKRSNELTLPSSRRRLEALEGVLALATGTVPQRDEIPSDDHRSAIASALAALRAVAEQRHEDAVAFLAEGELAVRTTLQRMIAAVIELVVASQRDSGIDLATRAQRISAIIAESDVRWPLVLAPASTRTAVLDSLEERDLSSVRAALESAFTLQPPLLGDELLRERRPFAPLTPRERAVLGALAETSNRRAIALRLHVSENTVKSQLRSLYSKLGAGTREEALTSALEMGLLYDYTAASAAHLEQSK